MSSWLAVLKIQLCPHLEGKGGKCGEVTVRPESEALMPAFHDGMRPLSAGPIEGARGRQASSPLWLGHLVQLWDGVEQAADPFLGPSSLLPQALPTPQPQFPQLYRGDTQGPG